MAAAAYDLLILVGILMATSFAVIVLRGGKSVPPGDPWYRAFLTAQCAGYFIGFWWRGGQTPGMRAWRIRVISNAGTGLPIGTAVWRFGAALLSLVALGLGFVWMLFDARNLTWHDRLSGSRVIFIPQPERRPGSQR